MDHVAILKKQWNLLSLILKGEKTIESRWYKNKIKPYNVIKADETIYLKETGHPITAKVTVKEVMQFDNLTPQKVHTLLKQYHKQIGIKEHQIDKFYELNKHKNYCILIFLKDPMFTKPFEIDKTGYGNMSAWLCVENINKIKEFILVFSAQRKALQANH